MPIQPVPIQPLLGNVGAVPGDLWAESGAMALTGRAGGPPLAAPSAVSARLAALQASVGDRVGVDVPALLGERAAIAGFTRNGAISCGGATRLLPCAPGWCAVSLARRSDVESVEAWLTVAPDPDDPWPAVSAAVRSMPAADVADRAQLLAMPVAALGSGPGRPAAAVGARIGDAPARDVAGALVVDLSSLWAGPLCGHLLQAAGARVVKVESTGRPDGARFGPAAFFDLLHAGQESVALDFADPCDVAALEGLLRCADVVIEASRPRALEQLGIEAASVVAGGSTRCWVSITAYGRDHPWRDRVGFGDDAAVAAGLVAWDGGGPMFCGDAIADPLAGLSAAEAVFAALEGGGRWIVDVSLHGAAASIAAPATGWSDEPWTPGADAAAPRARGVTGAAPALGADTERVLGELLGDRRRR